MTDLTPNDTAPQEPFGLDQPGSPGPEDMPSSDDKLWAGLSYLSQFILPAVLPVILLLSEQTKREPFVREHAIQSLALFVAAIVYEIAAAAVWAIITAIVPFLMCITWVIFLLPLIPFIYYGVQAFQGQRVEIPWLSNLLRQQGLL